jgi:uncharacterized membrane protein YphA (DoxX/SURF4 family)
MKFSTLLPKTWHGWLVFAMRLWLGYVFMKAGYRKLTSPGFNAARYEAKGIPEAFIDFYGSMWESGYFIPMLGIFQLLGGLLLLTQRWALLGALLLIPIALNIFAIHFFLDNRPGENLMTGFYLTLLAALAAYDYKKVKPIVA